MRPPTGSEGPGPGVTLRAGRRQWRWEGGGLAPCPASTGRLTPGSSTPVRLHPPRCWLGSGHRRATLSQMRGEGDGGGRGDPEAPSPLRGGELQLRTTVRASENYLCLTRAVTVCLPGRALPLSHSRGASRVPRALPLSPTSGHFTPEQMLSASVPLGNFWRTGRLGFHRRHPPTAAVHLGQRAAPRRPRPLPSARFPDPHAPAGAQAWPVATTDGEPPGRPPTGRRAGAVRPPTRGGMWAESSPGAPGTRHSRQRRKAQSGGRTYPALTQPLARPGLGARGGLLGGAAGSQELGDATRTEAAHVR